MRKGLSLALSLMLCLLGLLPAALAEEKAEAENVLPDDYVYPVEEYENFTHKTTRIYDSETLKYRIETFKVKG